MNGQPAAAGQHVVAGAVAELNRAAGPVLRLGSGVGRAW
jgi:hypothetical protein